MVNVAQVTPAVFDARVAKFVSFVRASGSETRTTVSPLTGNDVASLPVSSVADVQAAFAAASEAQARWALVPIKVRKRALLKLHDLILGHQDELLDLIQLESGKTRAHAWDEISHSALTARYYGRKLGKIVGTRHKLGVYPVLTKVRQYQQPKGVVGIISPWNYPLSMAIADGLAAIAGGNAVVHKPDSQSPLVALASKELMEQAGIPSDLWQIVLGSGSVIGTEIIQRADYICFTGSTATGKKVAAQCAERLIGCSLELGGKNPLIVLPGADMKKTVEGVVNAAFSSAGQLCVSIERIYVADSIYDEFRTAFVERVKKMTLGSGLNWDAEMGTLISSSQLATIQKHVDDAVDHGATVLAGGKARPDIAPWAFEPTVLENVPPTAECFADETFGPLVSLYSYATIDDAIAMANDSVYGLNASIWGPARLAEQVAREIKAGTVNINEGFAATFGSIDAPMGGMKQSGMGRRQGAEGLLRFTEAQAVGTQRLIPVSGPHFMSQPTYKKLLTLGLKGLRLTPRA